MPDDVDRLIHEIEDEGGIRVDQDQRKGLLSLIKSVVEAKRRDSMVRVYEMMKRSGWGLEVEPDEYVVKVLSNGFKGFGDEELAQQVQDEYDRFCKAKFDSFRV